MSPQYWASPRNRGDIALRTSAVAETRRKFDRDFREFWCRSSGRPETRSRSSLGIWVSTRAPWGLDDRDRQARAGGNRVLIKDDRVELVRLRRENAELAMKRDVLKRSFTLWVKDSMIR